MESTSSAVLPSSDADLDLAAYARAPIADVPTTLTLARQLIAHAPARPPAGVKTSTAVLLSEVENLEKGYAEVQRLGEPSDKRTIDSDADCAWSCFEGRLASLAGLPTGLYPEAARAAELHRRIFPDKLRFTQLEYGAQWAEAEWRLKLIQSEHLQPELNKLCGEPFLKELDRTHKAYGVMVGATQPKTRPKERPNLATLRRRVAQALVAHQIQLVAMYLAGDARAKAAALAGLRPTDEHRERLAMSPTRTRPDAPTPGPIPAPAPEPAPAPVT